MHAFTGTLPAAAQRNTEVTKESCPGPVAHSGRGYGTHPEPSAGHTVFAGNVQVPAVSRPAARVAQRNRIFSVTRNCSACGTCVAACPAGNIVLDGKRPAWGRHCRLCLACIRSCPAQAIRVGKRRRKRS